MAEEVQGTDGTDGGVVVESGAAAEAKPAFDRSAVETATAARMAAVFGDEPAAEATDENADEAVEETPVNEEESAEDNEEPVVKEAAVKPPVVKPATGNSPTLPEPIRRSLKAYGWDDEQIDTNLKALGASFITTASKIHDNRNTETARMAAEGRAARERSNAEAAQRAANPPKTEALKALDVAALKEKYGEDKMVDEIAGPINAVIAQINQLMPQVQNSQKAAQQAEMVAMGKQIEDFFGSKDLKPYGKLYGDPAVGELSEANWKSRNKVLMDADALMWGAQKQGRILPLNEAMQMAHDSVSSGFKIEAVRSGIKKELVTRNKGISLKPANKGQAGLGNVSGPVKTRQDLESRVAANLRATFAK